MKQRLQLICDDKEYLWLPIVDTRATSRDSFVLLGTYSFLEYNANEVQRGQIDHEVFHLFLKPGLTFFSIVGTPEQPLLPAKTDNKT